MLLSFGFFGFLNNPSPQNSNKQTLGESSTVNKCIYNFNYPQIYDTQNLCTALTVYLSDYGMNE